MHKTIIHAQMIQKRLDDKKLQIQECIVQEVKALDAILEDKAQEHCLVPTGKTFASRTTKVESEPPNGSNADIPNQCESKQALNVSAADQASVFIAMTIEQRSSTLVLHQMTSDHNRSELGIHDHSIEPSSSKLVPTVVPLQ
ncbi:hypothetical protein Tco_1509558 [Tanacetum coccineum]